MPAGHGAGVPRARRVDATEQVARHHTANLTALEPAGEPNDTLPDRVAAAYYGNTFDVPVRFTDGQTHRVELYMMDYDQAGRAQSVTATDNAGGAVLSTTSVSGFGKGVYLIYDVSGSVSGTFDNNFQMTSESVNGANPISPARGRG